MPFYSKACKLSKKSNLKRYLVQAKRRTSKEKWSEWVNVNSYRDAVRHACRIEELGYAAKIVVKDKEVEELRNIFGNSFESAEYADAVLDAGFRKESELVREIFEDITKAVDACTVKKSLFISSHFDISKFNEKLTKLKKKYDYSEDNDG